MKRSRPAASPAGTLGRYKLTNRYFDDSIENLTAESIEASLTEIGEALSKRYGAEPVKRPAKTRPVQAGNAGHPRAKRGRK